MRVLHRIAFFDCDFDHMDTLLAQRSLGQHSLSFFSKSLNEILLEKPSLDFDFISVMIGSKVDEASLKHLPQLSYVGTRSTGYDHLDMEILKERNISVSNVPHYAEVTVAEYAFALALALWKQIPLAVRKQDRDDRFLNGLMGLDLYGKTLGIVGAGHIGSHLAKIAHGFSMKILAYDKSPEFLLEDFVDLKYVPLDVLLSDSDMISLNLNGSQSNYHFLSQAEFKKMKRKPILVNTSRGTVVDNHSLLEALDNGSISGAALDVIEDSPEMEGVVEALYHHRKVLVTPHSAFFTREAVQRISKTSVENISSFINGNPQNLLTYKDK